MHVVKAKKEEEYWPRLSTSKTFDKQYVATDWARYVDEDDEAGAFDMSSLEGAAVRSV